MEPSMAKNPIAQTYDASPNFPEDMVAERNGEPSAEEKETLRQAERKQGFAYGLAKKRDEWIAARRQAGVDRRWREDTDQYHAIDNVNRAAAEMMKSVEQGFPVTSHGAAPHRSTVFIGLTRQKTNSAEARLSDIVLPTDDKNFGVDPTPNPQLTRQLKDESPVVDAMGHTPTEALKDPATGSPALDANGNQIQQPLRKKDVAAAAAKVAREAADAMEQLIDDQFVECDYAAEVRKMLHEAAVLGTGVLKGPIPTHRTRKAWLKQEDPAGGPAVHTLQQVSETRPASMWISAWNVWPDPACGDDVQRGEGVFERELGTRRTVQDFAKQPHYDADALRQALEIGPQRTKVFNDIDDPRTKDLPKDTLFEIWHYVGDIAVEDMRAYGVEGLEDYDDPLTRVSGCVVMVNDVVVKAYLNPMETGDLPYDFMPWEKVSDSVWGYGVPYLMRSQQRVLNSAWRQMMDNAGISSGPQIVLKKGSIMPADGKWELHSRKVWYANSDVEDVEKAFTAVNIDSHQSELQAIIQMAEDLADKETGQPLITQGEQGSAPETVGGMQMLMNSANVVLRRLVKQFDDYVTKRHVRRYYDFNMAYSEDDSVKGDFEVNAKGSSALLVRDVQNQAYLQLLQLATNPTWAPIFKLRDLMAKALGAQHIPVEEVLKSEDELKREAEIAAKNPPKDPALIVAMAREKEATNREQLYASEVEMRKEMQAQNFAAKLEGLKLTREIEMLKLANAKDLTLEQIRAQLAEVAINDRTKKELYAAEAALKTSADNPTNEGI
jgi:hypothetical protein